MIVRVARRAAQSNAKSVVVAADHPEIVSACVAHGIAAILTSADHASGSDRLAEASLLLGLDEAAIIVNVQGDEPMLAPALIDEVAALLVRRDDCVMSTAAHPIADPADFDNANIVKVVLDASQRALYFSRAPIPWPRDDRSRGALGTVAAAPLRHVGLYAYRAGFLRRFPTLGIDTPEDLARARELFALHGGVGFA